jgi:hypothetical protein
MNKEQQQIIDKVYGIYFDTIRDDSMDWLDEKQFIDKIKTDTFTSELWGLKIEERELSLEERFNIKYHGGKFSIFQENYPNTHKRNNPNDLLDAFDIPTKLITITYNDKIIESYE